MSSKTGGWLILLGVFVALGGLIILPAAARNGADRNCDGKTDGNPAQQPPKIVQKTSLMVAPAWRPLPQPASDSFTLPRR